MKRTLVNCLLIASLVLASLTSVAVAKPVLGENLAGWWLFDEGSGSVAKDYSGNGNDGYLFGDVEYTDDAVLGSAIDFTGATGTVAIHNDASLEPVTGTIEIWIKINEPQQADIVTKTTNKWVRTGETGGFSVYGLRITEDGTAYGFVGNNDPATPNAPWRSALSPSGLVTTGEWHHLAMRWDGNTVATFVDGVLQAETAYFPVPDIGLSYHGASNLYFGVGTSGGGEFTGQLDDARFYGEARTDLEIFTDFQSRGHKPAKPLGQNN